MGAGRPGTGAPPEDGVLVEDDLLNRPMMEDPMPPDFFLSAAEGRHGSKGN